jgi:hypothetical protein
LAWQFFTEVKHILDGSRKARADFKSLMQLPHRVLFTPSIKVPTDYKKSSPSQFVANVFASVSPE